MIKKSLIAGIIFAVMITSLMGCTRNPTHLLTNPTNITNNSSTEADWSEEPSTQWTEDEKPENAASIVEAMNNSAFNMYDLLSDGQSIMISPYSINMALSMLVNGAQGETKEQMMNALGAANLDEWNQMNQFLMREDHGDTCKLYLANSVWLSKDAQIKDTAQADFFDPVNRMYQTDNFEVDFKDPNTLSEINGWVSEKTEGMIDPFLNQLDSSTQMCLVNSIYFEGVWLDKFLEDDTHDASFYGENGEQTVPTMHMYDNDLVYLEDASGLKGVELAYEGNSMVMDILIADESSTQSTQEILSSMTPEERTALISSFDSSNYESIQILALPKFEYETELLSLNKALAQLGMPDAFNPDIADFSKISDYTYLQDAYHKAKIIVDENGTKAAAATALVMNEMAAAPAEHPINFIIDKPFFYCIRDINNGEILFMGYMSDIPF